MKDTTFTCDYCGKVLKLDPNDGTRNWAAKRGQGQVGIDVYESPEGFKMGDAVDYLVLELRVLDHMNQRPTEKEICLECLGIPNPIILFKKPLTLDDLRYPPTHRKESDDNGTNHSKD